jgi:small-conductance mechanosensitive channel
VINFFWILFFIALGLIIETVVKRKVLSQQFQIDSNKLKEMGPVHRLNASMANELPDIIGLCLFFGTSYASFFLFDKTNSPVAQLSFHAVLINISMIRTVSILSKIFLSPTVSNFRVLPLDTQAASIAHRLIVATFSYIVTVLMFSAVVRRLGGEQDSVLLLQLFFATLLLAVTAIVILIFKSRIKNYILGGEEIAPDEGWARKQFASVWHILAILYLALLWVLLIADIANPGEITKGAFLLSFFVVPIWMIADKIVQWIVVYAMSSLKIHQNHYDDMEEVSQEIVVARKKGKKLYLKAKGFAQAAVVVALGIWVAGLWNIQIPYISTLAAALLDSIIIMTLALIFWQFISSYIERKIQESQPEKAEEDKSDDEWGGAASRGRSYTLLPMIRKFVASVLVVMVTLTILSSIGVDIGPLLAGAGVVGLAVGFGAQKLVSDMFSGFFYLLDDAFRVGEYLTAGSVSGTVESITLRNVMLRHHRGMLQIVPHSELGAITNFMRGGMIVKFNLDFPYDANIDKIRKIIKKVGIAMLDDEEIGKDFIQPVKSQGVREITNSVMTIRVKFTAQPGTHFVIRREAFKRITEALSAAGIQYAHKKVIVDVPGLSEQDGGKNLSPEQARTITSSVGAAALASLDEEITGAEDQEQPS